MGCGDKCCGSSHQSVLIFSGKLKVRMGGRFESLKIAEKFLYVLLTLGDREFKIRLVNIILYFSPAMFMVKV